MKKIWINVHAVLPLGCWDAFFLCPKDYTEQTPNFRNIQYEHLQNADWIFYVCFEEVRFSLRWRNDNDRCRIMVNAMQMLFFVVWRLLFSIHFILILVLVTYWLYFVGKRKSFFSFRISIVCVVLHCGKNRIGIFWFMHYIYVGYSNRSTVPFECRRLQTKLDQLEIWLECNWICSQTRLHPSRMHFITFALEEIDLQWM